MGKNCCRAARLLITVGVSLFAVIGTASASPIAESGRALLGTARFGSGIILVRGGHGGHKRGGHLRRARHHAYGRHAWRRHGRRSWDRRYLLFGHLREPIFGS